MLFARDDDDFPVKCPRCKNEFYEKLGSLKLARGTRCPDPACGTNIGLETEQLDRMLKDAREHPNHFWGHFLRLRKPE